jgi:hypothetical protein
MPADRAASAQIEAPLHAQDEGVEGVLFFAGKKSPAGRRRRTPPVQSAPRLFSAILTYTLVGERPPMYPLVPAELIHAAVQLTVCFVAFVGTLLGLAWSGRT